MKRSRVFWIPWWKVGIILFLLGFCSVSYFNCNFCVYRTWRSIGKTSARAFPASVFAAEATDTSWDGREGCLSQKNSCRRGLFGWRRLASLSVTGPTDPVANVVTYSLSLPKMFSWCFAVDARLLWNLVTLPRRKTLWNEIPPASGDTWLQSARLQRKTKARGRAWESSS